VSRLTVEHGILQMYHSSATVLKQISNASLKFSLEINLKPYQYDIHVLPLCLIFSIPHLIKFANKAVCLEKCQALSLGVSFTVYRNGAVKDGL
jgi:hypothetical protein